MCLVLDKQDLTLALAGDWSGVRLHCCFSLSQSWILQHIEADLDNPFSLNLPGLFYLDPSSLAALFHFPEYGQGLFHFQFFPQPKQGRAQGLVEFSFAHGNLVLFFVGFVQFFVVPVGSLFLLGLCWYFEDDTTILDFEVEIFGFAFSKLDIYGRIITLLRG